MPSRLRRHFGYTHIALTVTLVFAMSGGAYAASKYLITSTKQISPKVLKALAGKAGPKGATGLAGPAGPKGETGAQGKEGPVGKEGAVGKEGTNGTGVIAKEVKTTETACSKHGGSSFITGSTTTLACNGKEGSPWTSGGTLPKGATEEGTWMASIVETPFHTIAGNGAVSFGIPLSSAPTVAYIKEDEEGKEHTAECPGTLEDPKATEDFLCVYTKTDGAASFESAEAFTAGANLKFEGAAAGLFAHGTWAVTG